MVWPLSRAGRRRSVCKRRRSWRPGLEQLETRLTPSVFALASFNGANGASPQGTLALDAGGNVYGAANRGGAGNEGTVFEVAKGSGAVTVLASFPSGDNSTGQPQGGVMMDAAGNLYGTTF